MKGKLSRLIIMFAVLALVAAACSNEADDTTTAAPATTVAPSTTAAQTTTQAPTTSQAVTTTEAPMTEVSTGIGVTDDPCPGGMADNGCIYLGVLTDESGPFAGAAPGLLAGQRAFWAAVNAAGGIGGEYDVALPDDLKKDTQYSPEVFVQSYNDIAGDVAAIAQSLGTSQTIAALDDYERDDIIAAPMSWWSGWGFDSADRGLVVEFGTNYCFEAMNAVDWSMEALPAAGRPTPATVGILAIPNDYGADYAAGVKIAAEANSLTVAWEAPVIPVSLGGDPTQIEAVQQVVNNPVDVVYLVTGPTETAAIVAGAVSQGATSIFIGAAPSWNVGLLASAAAPVFEAGVYFQSSYTGPWDYDSVGHEKMRQTLGAIGVDPNDFFVSGWVSQYGIKAALEAAYDSGDLTHAGIVAAWKNLESVDYEGMMPSRSFGGDPETEFPRQATVGAVDTTSSTGIALVQDFFVGPTAEAYSFTAPCSG